MTRVLPSGALDEAMRAARGRGELDLGALAVLAVWGLAVWGLAGSTAALRWFRWD